MYNIGNKTTNYTSTCEFKILKINKKKKSSYFVLIYGFLNFFSLIFLNIYYLYLHLKHKMLTSNLCRKLFLVLKSSELLHYDM